VHIWAHHVRVDKWPLFQVMDIPSPFSCLSLPSSLSIFPFPSLPPSEATSRQCEDHVVDLKLLNESMLEPSLQSKEHGLWSAAAWRRTCKSRRSRPIAVIVVCCCPMMCKYGPCHEPRYSRLLTVTPEGTGPMHFRNPAGIMIRVHSWQPEERIVGW